MGAYVIAGIVKELDHVVVKGRFDVGITGVVAVELPVLVPGFVDPRGAAAAAAVHEKFYAAGEKHAVAEGLRWFRLRLKLREGGPSGVHGTATANEREDAHGGFFFIEEFLVKLPIFRRDTGIFCGGHAFFVEVGHHAEEAVATLFVGVGWDDFLHQTHGGFFQDTGGLTLFVANDDAGFGIFGFRGDFRETEGIGVGDAVVSGGVPEP